MDPKKTGKRRKDFLFFQSLEEEIVKAKSSNKLVYIQMGANRKLGPDMIKVILMLKVTLEKFWLLS